MNIFEQDISSKYFLPTIEIKNTKAKIVQYVLLKSNLGQNCLIIQQSATNLNKIKQNIFKPINNKEKRFLYTEEKGLKDLICFSKMRLEALTSSRFVKAFKNILIGLRQGYTTTLELRGIGYQAIAEKNKENEQIRFNLGWSHQRIIQTTKDIKTTITSLQGNSITITLFGLSKLGVSLLATKIYHLRKPEPYKGKGVRYDKEKFFAKKK